MQQKSFLDECDNITRTHTMETDCCLKPECFGSAEACRHLLFTWEQLAQKNNPFRLPTPWQAKMDVTDLRQLIALEPQSSILYSDKTAAEETTPARIPSPGDSPTWQADAPSPLMPLSPSHKPSDWLEGLTHIALSVGITCSSDAPSNFDTASITSEAVLLLPQPSLEPGIYRILPQYQNAPTYLDLPFSMLSPSRPFKEGSKIKQAVVVIAGIHRGKILTVIENVAGNIKYKETVADPSPNYLDLCCCRPPRKRKVK